MFLKVTLVALTAIWGAVFCIGALQESLAYIRRYPVFSAELGMSSIHEVAMWIGGLVLLLCWLSTTLLRRS